MSNLWYRISCSDLFEVAENVANNGKGRIIQLADIGVPVVLGLYCLYIIFVAKNEKKWVPIVIGVAVAVVAWAAVHWVCGDGNVFMNTVRKLFNIA